MKIANVLIGLLLLVAACKTEKETPNGFKFTVVESGDGVLAKPQEIMVFDFVMKDSKDSIWQSTYKEEMPGYLMVADTSALKSEDGMMQMFRMLSKGDSVHVTMSAVEFFRDLVRAPLPMGIDSTLNIAYLIRVTGIMSQDDFRKFQMELAEKKSQKQKSLDLETIKKYLADNSITAQEDTSGIQYVIHNSTGGKKPVLESCVEVKYTGKFMADGRIFDKNDRIGFPLTDVIPGWQYSIPKLAIGDSGTFYIPSSLAYGPRGYPGAIPPNAILIFDVQVLAVGDSLDQATRTCK
ncbi:MAG TPA: FKBP-type peptidyl-prolyl cis-trans isomerase [Ohtaekwangia sp.]